MDQDATWYRVGVGPGHGVLNGDPPPPKKGHSSPQFSSHVYFGQTTGWIKTALGKEVDLGPGHTVLDRAQLPRERGTTAPTLFSAHVYCGQTVAHLSYC